MTTIVKGYATVYDPTGQPTASGKPYGLGVGIPMSWRLLLPYETMVKITSGTTSLTVPITDCGNFGPGQKYEFIRDMGINHTRIVDLPRIMATNFGLPNGGPVTMEILQENPMPNPSPVVVVVDPVPPPPPAAPTMAIDPTALVSAIEAFLQLLTLIIPIFTASNHPATPHLEVAVSVLDGAKRIATKPVV